MFVLKNCNKLDKKGKLIKEDIYIKDGKISYPFEDAKEIDCTNLLVFPGLTDLHVHLREPGFEHKETIKTGTYAAAKGGVTTLFSMPNLNPYPDNIDSLMVQLNKIKESSLVHVFPYSCVTVSQKSDTLADLKNLSKYVLGFSDDGVGFSNKDLLKEAMKIAKANNLFIASHAEDKKYPDTYLQECYAIRDEIELLKDVNCKYHFCHVSTARSVEFIKEAKMNNLNVTCEVTPHHLFLSTKNIDSTGRYKMNPPLRSEYDMQMMQKYLLDGTIDCIATDHAPHEEEVKNISYDKASNGVIGLETLMPLCITKLYKEKNVSLNFLKKVLVDNPRKIAGLDKRDLSIGEIADIILIDIDTYKIYEEKDIASKSKNSCFIGMNLCGYIKYTFVDGKLVYGGNDSE